ncbi:unnamed protein product [Orchesella dallaii]|uniref:acid phosphatase n=1 Tax=Orchesella dallaii TaxID=48710 RepID=A0ABP1QDE4_9HEXA
MILISEASSYFPLRIARGLLVILVLLQSATCTKLEAAKRDSLQLVQVLFRHGDRAPTYTYPNDPYGDISTYWPEGLAQLTNRGKMQQYELGRYLRQRYDGYLGEKYTQKELYVTSSDMDRTIMSLESNLAGLFPPVNKWNPNIEWQPIPLRTIPWKEDKLLHVNVRCPRYHEIRRNFLSTSDVVKKINEDNQEFIQYCAEKSGLNARTVKDLYPLLDVLYAQSQHNLSLPEWAQGDTLPKLIQLHSTTNTWPTYTDEMKRLWGGPLLGLLIKNMMAIAGHLGSNPEDAHSVSHGVNRKMLMYSAHDSTLARIMNTMGVFEPHCPPYAAALIVELHRDPDTHEYYVEIHYRNDTTQAPYLLTPEKCGFPCSFRKMMEITKPLIPVDWAKECNLESRPTDFFNLRMGSSTTSTGVDGELIHSCYLSPSQLTLMGIGLFSMSALAVLVIGKVLQGRKEDGYYDDSGSRPFFVSLWQNKPFYGAAYEKL